MSPRRRRAARGARRRWGGWAWCPVSRGGVALPRASLNDQLPWTNSRGPTTANRGPKTKDATNKCQLMRPAATATVTVATRCCGLRAARLPLRVPPHCHYFDSLNAPLAQFVSCQSWPSLPVVSFSCQRQWLSVASIDGCC
jgi:hypothetical protein